MRQRIPDQRRAWARAAAVTSLVILGSTAAALPAADVRVTATLDDDAMTTDGSVRLKVTVEGRGNAQLHLDPVEGLRFHTVGNNRRVSILNNETSVVHEITLAVTASEPGTYEIGPVYATAGGTTVDSGETLRLEVVAGTGRPSPPSQPGVAPAPNMPQKPAAPAPRSRPANTVEDGLAFLEAKPAKTDLYVGELVPVEIKAYFRSGERVSLRSLPAVEGGSFTLQNQEGDARREQVSVGGVPYTVLTFYAGMTPVKPGSFPAEVTLDATVVVREKGRSPMRGFLQGSPFDDGFFDDFFARHVPKDISLASDPIEITVSELPAEGQPPGFGGAVGEFSATARTDAESVEAGDPVTVVVHVEGEGNFDRLTMPELTDPDGWKTYPPTSRFVAADAIGKAGVKMFEQVIVPEHAGITEIPALTLPFFNPETGQYESARTDPIPLAVTGTAPSPPPAGDRPADAPAETDLPAPPAEAPPGPAGVRPPLYAQPWFLVSLAAAAALLIAALATAVVRRFTGDPDRARRRRRASDLGRSVAAMDEAIARADAPAFFASMRAAVQTHLAGPLGIRPSAITAADAADPEARELLTTADAVAYSGQPVPAGELRAWKDRALRLIGPR